MNYGRQGIKKQQLALNAKGPKWAKKLLLILAVFLCVSIIGIGILGGAMGIGAFMGILSSAPDIKQMSVAPSGKSSFVYDTEGNQISKLVTANANRIPVASEVIPQDLKDAFVAIEDQRFYTHNGIDFQSIFHAAVDVITSASLEGGGGSTITQQLLKNNVFVDWMAEDNNIQKVKRKIQEQYCAVQLEKVMDKDTILTYYLNTINLSQNCLGVEAASRRYFNKSVSELSLSECAVIAGITKYPTKYNPILHPDENRKRMETVLDKMEELGYISSEEKKAALADDVYSRIMETNEMQAEEVVQDSYFVDALKIQLKKDLIAAGYSESQAYTLMYSGGLRINSTMDPNIQAICDEEFANPDNYAEGTKFYLNYQLTTKKADGSYVNYSAEMLAKWKKQYDATYERLYKDPEDANADIEAFKAETFEAGEEIVEEKIEITPQPQVAFTVIEQSTGHCVAMIGGRGEKKDSMSFNRATQAMRQPGSCFKVLAAFGPAIDACGKVPSSVYLDAPFAYVDGTPVKNWYGENVYRGIQSIRLGIVNSLNIIAVKTITEITPELAFQYLENMGFTTLHAAKQVGTQVFTDITQPLALGGLTDGIYDYELTAAYAGIANGGIYIEPKLYTTVYDSDGNLLLDNSAPVTHRIFSEETAYMLTDCMVDCAKTGSARQVNFGMSVAGKTGTTTDEKDIWIVAYTPYYTAACWSGYDNPHKMNTNEQKVPKQLWKAVMQRVHADLPDPGFDKPSTIVKCIVCSQSGKLPRPGICDGCLKEEIFTAETVPTEYCDVHYVGRICGYDNLRATDQCPFCYEGVATMNPIESERLAQGSSMIAAELDPLAASLAQAAAVQSSSGYCHHNEQFFMQENWEGILAQEQAEYNLRVQAAQAAAAQAALQASEQ